MDVKLVFTHVAVVDCLNLGPPGSDLPVGMIDEQRTCKLEARHQAATRKRMDKQRHVKTGTRLRAVAKSKVLSISGHTLPRIRER